VSTVLIQSTRTTRTSLPVLKRGGQDRGVTSQPNMTAPTAVVPTLYGVNVVTKDGTRQAAELGDVLALEGALLDGAAVTAVFRHDLFTTEIPVDAGATGQLVRITLPQVDVNAAPATWPDWPAGSYTVTLRIQNPGKIEKLTNGRGFLLAPRIFTPPRLSGAADTLKLTVSVYPRVLAKQRLDVYVGSQPFRPATLAAEGSELSVSIANVTPSDVPVPVLVRVDSVDSQFVRDRALQPPQLDPRQTVQLPV
jgi:hypothetical protein